MSDALKRLLLAIVAQLPFMGAVWMNWSNVKEHPVAATLLGVLWEFMVLLGAFFTDVWAALRQDALKVTVDWIRASVRGFAPGFRRQYNRWLVREYGLFNVRGLGLINTFTLSLEQVFVELRVHPANPQKLNLDPLTKREIEGNLPIWDLLRAAMSSAAEAPAVLAILGPPGCGKTTLLQHVAVTLASNRQSRFRLRAYTPILLFLRDHIGAISRESPPNLGELAQSYFSNKKLFGKTPPEAWFEKQLRAGRCMVLLDGLDEVANLQHRQTISRWVDSQVAAYPECPFVITSRPQGYKDAPLARADVLEVQPLGVKQVRQFIERWYLANEIKSSGNQFNAAVQHKASKDANDLLQRLQLTPSVNALTVNPLLLTMVAMVHRYHGALPGSRVELYKEICEVLLGRWRQAKGVQDELKAAQKLVVLQPLASYMMEKELRDIGTDEAMAVIAAPLERIGAAKQEGGEFLASLRESSGLVQEREAGKWSFAHLTFQEYLAANHWLEKTNTPRDWKQLVDRSWWREMLRLYASQGDATGLVKACLEMGSVQTLTLAADCLEEAREIAPEVRQAAEERVIADLESTDLARQHLAAEVQLVRRLKSLQPIDDERAIDLKHLTCAEYQLFLDEMRAQGKYYQPDHWSETRFARGQGRKPVCGVRAADALEFCRWLTLREGGRVRYRPPRPDEARSHPGEGGGLGTWCLDGTNPAIEGVDQARRDEAIQIIGWQRLTEFDLFHTFLSVIAQERDIAFGYERVLPVLARALKLNIALERDLDSGQARVRDLSLDLAFDLAPALKEGLRYSFAIDHAFNRARLLARVRGRARLGDIFADREEASEEYVLLLQEIRRLLQASREKDSEGQPRIWLAGVVDALIGIGVSQTMVEMRKAQRVLSERVLEQALKVAYGLGHVAMAIGPEELRAMQRGVSLMMAREAGQLPAWEGIRVVRETVSDEL